MLCLVHQLVVDFVCLLIGAGQKVSCEEEEKKNSEIEERKQ